MRLICVRHGESPSNASPDRLALPEPEGDRLTERGLAQARDAAEAVAAMGGRRLLSSPMRRATETAAVISERTGIQVEVNPLIHELREFEGYTDLGLDEQRARRWSERMTAHADDPHYGPEGAESFAEVVSRVRQFKAEVEAMNEAGPVIAVTHGIFLRFFLLDSVLGDQFVPGLARRLWMLRSINCGISVFTHGESARALDLVPDGWSCLSWMAPPAAPRGRSSADRRASAATAR
ncbi:MAG: histidine phosphatase family protein [Solirubrobacterales bacterium]